MLGHLFPKDLLRDGLHTLSYPSLHVALDVLIESLVRGQVCLLTQPTTYQTLSAHQTSKLYVSFEYGVINTLAL
jgi:hypothetical protein